MRNYAKINFNIIARDPRTAKVLKNAFSNSGLYPHITVLSGLDALSAYLSSKAALKPHMLFLDITGSKWNELKFIWTIRKSRKDKNLLIVAYDRLGIISAEDTFVYGGNIHISNPKDFARFTKSMKNFIGLGQDFFLGYANQETYFVAV